MVLLIELWRWGMDKKLRPGRPRKPEDEKAVRVNVSLRPSTLALVKEAAERQFAPVSRYVDGVLRERLLQGGAEAGQREG